MERNVFGYVNSKPVYSRDEFVFERRRFGALTTDEEIFEFAKKSSHNWYSAGWHQDFCDFYLSDYALSEPYQSLTKAEFARLKEMQTAARAERKAKEDALEWRYDHTIYWADNSEEEVWINKYGETKTIMTVYPHGDCC